jgi:hypothetical protein
VVDEDGASGRVLMVLPTDRPQHLKKVVSAIQLLQAVCVDWCSLALWNQCVAFLIVDDQVTS